MIQMPYLWIAFILVGFAGFVIGHTLACLFNRRQDDGIITVDLTEDRKIVWNIAYNGDPYELQKKKTVTFKIQVKE